MLSIDDIIQRLSHLRSVSASDGNTPVSLQVKVDGHIVRIPVEKVGLECRDDAANACVVLNGDEGV